MLRSVVPVQPLTPKTLKVCGAFSLLCADREIDAAVKGNGEKRESVATPHLLENVAHDEQARINVVNVPSSAFSIVRVDGPRKAERKGLF